MVNTIRKGAAVLIAAIMLMTALTICPLQRTNAAVSGVWPAEPAYTNITTYFDPQRNVNNYSGYHNAIDIEANGGSDIYAAYGGEVISADWKDAYGYMVIIYHADLGVYTFYAHASQLITAAGNKVAAGDLIAKVGSTGDSSGNHIHFGVCDSLLSGWPNVTYYDPLSFFSFAYGGNTEGGNGNELPSDEDLSDEYAGIYTTKDVTSYLNIRAGRSSSTAAVGQVPPDAIVTVFLGDGQWAYVEYNGIRGYCSMDFLQKISDIEAGMTIENVAAPEGILQPGKPFSLRGEIKSALPIAKVWGGIYTTDGEPTEQCAEASPNTLSYSLAVYFDRQIIFNKLSEGGYIYKISAEDSAGNVFELISTSFIISSGYNGVKGDLNGDGGLTAEDAAAFQDYLLGKGSITKEQYLASDVNNDGSVDVFDLVSLKKAIIKSQQAKNIALEEADETEVLTAPENSTGQEEITTSEENTEQ